MRRAIIFVVLAGILAGRPAFADDVTEAKNYFKAGASAYGAGDYLAAIQALEAAYRLTPLPAIAFSLAQAERRQYFVSREPAHLVRAIELYRTYLKQVPSGGRRADATDALTQLEPLALGIGTAPPGEPAAAPGPREPAKTRIMVTSEAVGARISLDGAPPKPAPLIAEVAAGEHRVEVSAEGFFSSERRVVAIAGELVPHEVELEERPAVVLVEPSIEADLYVDGAFSGRVQKGSRIELPSGAHQLAFASQGRKLEVQTVRLRRGETRRLPVELHWTNQRIASVSLLIVSGATLATGVVFTGLGVATEREADRILARSENEALTPSELSEYEDAREDRDRYRAIAIGNYAISAASLVTGALLYGLDEPNVREIRTHPEPDRTQPKLDVRASLAPLPSGLAFSARMAF